MLWLKTVYMKLYRRFTPVTLKRLSLTLSLQDSRLLTHMLNDRALSAVVESMTNGPVTFRSSTACPLSFLCSYLGTFIFTKSRRSRDYVSSHGKWRYSLTG